MTLHSGAGSDCPSCGRRPGYADPVPVCPGCERPDTEFVMQVVARKVRRQGSVTAACLACEQVTFVFEPDMVCAACEQMRPDVNDGLRLRFAREGAGDVRDAPCTGCGFTGAARPVTFPVECPWRPPTRIPQEAVSPEHGLIQQCSGCGAAIRVPPAVWCPKCGLNIRSRGKAELVREANL